MRIALLLVAIFTAPAAAHAQAPAYQRVRTGAMESRGMGVPWHGGPYAGGYGGYYNPYFAPPIVVGSYYQRPYPYHFDYFRGRWGTQPAIGAEQPIASPDCPCETPPPVK